MKQIKKGQIYSSRNSNGYYKIVAVEKIEGKIETIIMRNVNNKADNGFSVSEYELERDYRLL